ncbi:hypothetical protein SEA_RICKMORE_78 [Gordonia phage Rickmore]|uniref:Uncharacterized protein n=1 Tax=Gordonia phage Rickmore TaxID=2507854 RepID=A0A410TBC4_9CAUD|nr:hypothetical protein HWC05_gp78 [Gordonia phage Rickmore]QAU06312.1 hypothetical protein SEA_RICKMORE_78 [Gordonia phage Rickmore]
MEYTLLIVERIVERGKESKDETVIEGYTTQRGLMTVLEKYTGLDDYGKLKFVNELGMEGSAEHKGVPYAVYVTGPVGSMVRSLGGS